MIAKMIFSFFEKYKKATLFTSLFVLLAFTVSAQEVIVNASLSEDTILIGEQTDIKLEIKQAKNKKIAFPEINEDFVPGIEIIQQSKIDTVPEKQMLGISLSLTITSWDSGYYQIPPFEFMLLSENDLDTLRTKALQLTVNTVQVDTTKAIKDIKPPLEAPLTLAEIFHTVIIDWFPYNLLAVLIILGIIFFILLRSGRNKLPVFNKKPPEPAHIIALRELEQLKNEKYWQNNPPKKYYTRLTDIIRLYLERRFEIGALEQTSSQIIQSLRHSGNDNIQNRHIENLSHMFTLADLVKFAKETPIEHENYQCFEWAYDFVLQTKPIEIIKEDKSSKDTSQDQKNQENIHDTQNKEV